MTYTPAPRRSARSGSARAARVPPRGSTLPAKAARTRRRNRATAPAPRVRAPRGAPPRPPTPHRPGPRPDSAAARRTAHRRPHPSPECSRSSPGPPARPTGSDCLHGSASLRRARSPSVFAITTPSHPSRTSRRYASACSTSGQELVGEARRAGSAERTRNSDVSRDRQRAGRLTPGRYGARPRPRALRRGF